MKVKYVGPLPEVEVLGRTVKHNHQFEVTDDEAGRPPADRLATALAELHDAVAANDHSLAARLRDEIASIDFGEGLLAQPENYQPVTATKAKEADK